MASIEVKNLSIAYESGEACRDLNFEVNMGDYLCIVGENGAGKSSLMKALLGLVAPSKGSICFEKGITATQIGYLPQQTVVQKDFPASVYEIVLSGRLNKKGLFPFYSRKDREIAKEKIQMLGIEPIQHSCYRELSGGQQQRVLLARALCATEQILLLDEPVAGLDPMATANLYELIKDLNRNYGITIIMISHDVQNMVKEATHILHLQKEQKFFGPIAEYMDTPWATRLLGGETDASII